ncbi:MAG TPA: DoxX family protein [Vicinamibacterales bacterium]|nr:DoxX family protein [Vicinamibacterales bacterium]
MTAATAGLAGYAYAAMRIVAGFLFLFHGLQKILGMFGGQVPGVGSLRWAAGMIELIGGTMIAIGLFTSPVAFICSGEMAVAYFMAHLPRGFWPIQNGGELAALYAFVFLYIAVRGAGPLSVDRIWRRKG